MRFHLANLTNFKLWGHPRSCYCFSRLYIRPAEKFCVVTLQTPLKVLGQNLFGDQFWDRSDAHFHFIMDGFYSFCRIKFRPINLIRLAVESGFQKVEVRAGNLKYVLSKVFLINTSWTFWLSTIQGIEKSHLTCLTRA